MTDASSLPAAEPSNVPGVVERLAELRRQAQRRRYSGATPQLPSRQGILALAEDFVSVLYPRQMGEVGGGEIDYFVADKLTRAQAALERELALEYQLAPYGLADAQGRRRPAAEAAAELVDALPRLREQVDGDIRASLEADPSQGSFDELVFSSPGVAAILRHRIAHELFGLRAPIMAKIVAEESRSRTGIDIHPGAEIGEGFSVAHGAGLCIGETAIIGRNVRLHQAVMIGESFTVEVADVGDGGRVVEFSAAARGDGGRRRHPRIEDDVEILAGASLYGPITIGRGSLIGRNVFLTRSVPPRSQVE